MIQRPVAPRAAASATAESHHAAVAHEAPAPAAAPTAALSQITPAPPPVAEVPASGTLRITLKGHRIYVDGRYVGDGAQTREVTCGVHTLRIGAKGRKKTIDVPCGGEVVIAK
jgi:hypothetical protein